MEDKVLTVVIEGKPDCIHDWLDLPTIDICPPEYSRICKICGRSESWYYKSDEVTI